MDRGAKTTKTKVEAKRPVARKPRAPGGARVRELELRLSDALEQKAAMSEVLTAISQASLDLQPVFDMVAERAVKLCEANRAFVYRLDRDVLRMAAAHGASRELREFAEQNPIAPGRHSGVARAALERQIVHIADVQADPEYTFGAARVDPIRTVLAVPILKLAQLLGVIVIYRLEVNAFTDGQIALVQAFADQAAIAIENARLINELEARNHGLSEALEQQTATGQILRVISQAQTDVRPVFDTIAAAALNLCGATSALVTTFDGKLIHLAAIANVNPDAADAIRHTYPTPPLRTSANSRAILTGSVVAIPDVLDDAEYAVRAAALAGGFRSVLAVPLIRERSAIGAISVGRTDPGPFPDKQITLLQTLADHAVIAIENVRLFTELEARNGDLSVSLEQQTATSEVLRVIADSPNDVQPVLDTVAQRAANLCRAPYARVLLVDGDELRTVADHSVDGEVPIPTLPVALRRTSITGRAVLDGEIVHHADIVPLLDTEFPDARDNARLTGFRAVLAVPLMRESGANGAIFLWRREPGLFSPDQAALVQTFARQAAIAIDNVRLFNEVNARNSALTESLEQQNATSEVLRAIASSPTDLQPVLETVVRAAARFCGAPDVILLRIEGGTLRGAAGVGAYADVVARSIGRIDALEIPVTRGSVSGRAVLERRNIHVHDLAAENENEFPMGRELQRRFGHRTMLAAPLLREEVPLGVIALFRMEVRPFSDNQVELLKTFADQAVIAIENVRLFTELGARNRDLTEALEQQTATSDVLKVISRSAFDLQPVLDTVIDSAVRLCGAEHGHVHRYEGGLLRLAAGHSTVPAMLDYLREHPAPLGPGGISGVAGLERRPVHWHDVLEQSGYKRGEAQKLGGYRTMLAVPMLTETALLGVIVLWKTRVEPFTEKQIELVTTFADQAVIAIENVRLFTELEARNRDLTEALEQQTATSEILRAISGSPTDVQPVFEIIGESAEKLCDAEISVVTRIDGELIQLVASHGVSADGGASIGRHFPMRLDAETVTARTIRRRAVVHIADALADPDYESKDAASTAGYRACLGVPMLREGEVIGAIFVARRNSGLFTDSQVQLLKTFADQAVIAIENVRLFTELGTRNHDLTEALEQQTATSEILRVISKSQTDVQPVFDTIAAAALKLCGASAATLMTYDGALIHMAAVATVNPEASEAIRKIFPRRPSRDTAATRAILTHDVIAIPDVLEDPEYSIGSASHFTSFRSVLAVPLTREQSPIGAIAVGRPESGPFPDKQVDLLKTFADQAVIAIENVRLFKELEVRNRDLVESLEQQTATSDILRAISRSPTDVQPVFDTIAQRAGKLCDAEVAVVSKFDGTLIELAAIHGLVPEGVKIVRTLFPMKLNAQSVTARVIRGSTVVHIADVLAEQSYELKDFARAAYYRSALGVPIVRSGEVIGSIFVGRANPGLFTDSQIELLKTFADQAVIAIENVRLFTELGVRNHDLTEALEQQTAASEILRAISNSPTDLQPVFDTIARNALLLCEADYSVVGRYDGELLHLAAHEHVREEGVEAMRQLFPMRPSRATTMSRSILDRAVVHVPDVLEDPDYARPVALGIQNRSTLAVPMLRHELPIGTISVGRLEPKPFTEKQITLLKTFADQAVIAIENVRLFKELEDRNYEVTEALDRQTATSEILRVISRSPTDVQPVLDAIAASARRLCDGTHGAVLTYDGSLIYLAALDQFNPEGAESLRRSFPMAPSRASSATRAILYRDVINIADVLDDHEYVLAGAARASGYRSVVSVPMLRDGNPTGVITVTRAAPGAFPDHQIELLKTFADQAVIAIENVRLFKELESRTTELSRSVGELKALGEVGQAVSSTLDLATVLSTIVSRATELAGMDGGAIYEYDETREEFYLHTADRLPDELVEALRSNRIRKGEGAIGRLAVTGDLVEIRDITDEGVYRSRIRKILIRLGYRSLLAVPLLREDHLLGGLVVNRRTAGEFSPQVIELLKTFATQSALAIQNARLFREIGDKSRQLEIASQHKSEFLANMSHELRTPLNAIIGFSEVLADRMFGEVNDKQAEYLADILESGRHLLALINDILDLSKIEAGRMELDLDEFNLPAAIDNTVTLVRERAHRRGITLEKSMDERVGKIRADERKVKQVLLNLLSNALKFTPEGGRIDVRADARDGAFEISVTDTGVGIAPEDIEAVFEEFRQVGSTAKKVEGTGLGLAISRKFIELHGGRIWATSTPGKGSTFAFTLPLSTARAGATD